MDFKKGILGAVMGAATGLQAGKAAEYETEKESRLVAMKALWDENLARFKHGLEMEKLEEMQQGNVELEDIRHDHQTERDVEQNRMTGERDVDQNRMTTERDAEEHIRNLELEEKKSGFKIAEDAAQLKGKAALLDKISTIKGGGSSSSGSEGAAAGGLTTLDAQRVIDIGNGIQNDYVKKGKDIPDWLLNDWNETREFLGLPTVEKTKVPGFFGDTWGIELDQFKGGKGSGILDLGDVIEQSMKNRSEGGKKEDGKALSLGDVIAQVKKEREGAQPAPEAAEAEPSGGRDSKRQASRAEEQRKNELAEQAEKEQARRREEQARERRERERKALQNQIRERL